MMDTPSVTEVKPENHYNVDETGIMKKLGYNCLVIESLKQNIALVKHHPSHSWVSTIECISAVGKTLDPLD